MDEHISAVFPDKKFFAPRFARMADRRPALAALVQAFVAGGYHEALARREPRASTGPAVVTELPRIHYDQLDGDHSYAKYVNLRPAAGEWVLLAISYVAPVFTATDQIYVMNSLNYDEHLAWDGHDLSGWLHRPETKQIVSTASSVLEPFGIRYVAWNTPLLDERRPMSDKPDATVRELLFNFDQPH